MSQRLKTDELFPSYRESYQLHSLSQEVSQLHSTIQLKDKEIFYLTSQLVSLKEENMQKVMHLENTINQNKKELTELRYIGLKNKRTQSQKGDKAIQKLKYNYQLQLVQQKQSYESIIERITNQNKKQIEMVQEKLACVLSLQKKEQQSLKLLLQENKVNNDGIIESFKAQIQELNKEKQQLRNQIHRYSQNMDMLKAQFRTYGEKFQNKQKDYKIQIQKLKSTQLTSKETIISLEKEIKKLNENAHKKQRDCDEELSIYKQQIQKMNFLILKKDKELARVSQTNHATFKNSNQLMLNPVRQCNHLGLIEQLQRNLRIKNKQVQELSSKLQYWSKFVGIEKTVQEKTLDLQTAASNAIKAQSRFVGNLKKRNKI